jgi:hypothetical protein
MSKLSMLLAAMLASAGGAGCGSETDTGSVDANATELPSIEPGFYAGYDYVEGAARPLALALHDVARDVPEGFAGHYDLSMYNDDSGDIAYTSGFYKIYRYAGEVRVRFETYEGSDAGHFAWSVEDGTLQLGEFAMNQLNTARDPEDVMECEAFDVPDLFCEEGFTPWEYPSVSVERAEGGGYDITFGSCGYGAEDGDTVEVTTAENGDFEARLVTSYDETFIIRVPAGEPSRGVVLHASEADAEPVEAAKLVCH